MPYNSAVQTHRIFKLFYLLVLVSDIKHKNTLIPGSIPVWHVSPSEKNRGRVERNIGEPRHRQQQTGDGLRLRTWVWDHEWSLCSGQCACRLCKYLILR